MGVSHYKKNGSKNGKDTAITAAAVILGLVLAAAAAATVLLLVLPAGQGKPSSDSGVERVTAEDLRTDPGNTQDVQSQIKNEITVTGTGREAEVPAEETGSGQDAEPVKIDFNVSATSTLEASGYSYEPSNLTDLDASTCWADGDSGDGTGESITFTSSQPQTVRGLAVLPGYCKSSDLYAKNGAPSALRIEYEGKTVEYPIDEAELVYDSSNPLGGTIYIDFEEEVQISECKVTITDVRGGNKYDDCCITEMYLYG